MPNKEKITIDYLMSQIESGVLRSGEKIPSESDLSEQLGFNKWTISRAVGVLVERGILKRGIGRGGTTVTMKSLRVRGVIAYPTSLLSGYTFCAQMMIGATNGVRSRGYVLNYYQNVSPRMTIWDEIADSGAVGALATCAAEPPHDFPIPVMEAGGANFENHVMSDDLAGGRSLAEFVWSRGHRHPIIVTESKNDVVLRPRVAGMFEAFSKRGIKDMNSRLLLTNESGNPNPATILNLMMERDPECGVILFNSDVAAISFIQYLEANGKKVPDQFSVTGYANMREYQLLRQITTVNQFPEDIGFTAANYLIDLIEKKRKPPVKYLTITELIPGSTVR